MEGRTTFVIAHRLSTVSLADEVVVLDGGRIVDRGTHDELLEGCGFYREIAEHGLADSVFLQRDLEEPRGDGATVNENADESRFGNVFQLFAALWRLVRGEDQRGRKVRWMIRPAAPLPRADDR